jgi:hypothetical protein
MANSMNHEIGKYWMLYYQPNPEDGERITIALLLQQSGRRDVRFDPTFTKVRKLYPTVDVESLNLLLESLRDEIETSSDPEMVLSSYGPQLLASNARRVATPITDEMADMMLGRYVFPVKAQRRRAPPEKDVTALEIEALLRNAGGPDLQLKSSVKAREIIGRNLPGAKPIALAVARPDGWTLVDGVDLNALTTRGAITRADDVAHTYWAYGRAKATINATIKTVGVVLNGNSHLAPATHEAHDYVIHRFEAESDHVIDTASTEASRKLLAILS